MRFRGPIRLCCVLAVCLPLATGAMAQSAMQNVEMAAEYLHGIQKEDGLFNYEYDFLAGKWSTSDNIVRQGGTAYALALYYAETRDAQAAESVRRALDAFEARSVGFADGLLLSANGTLADAKAGATALALISALLVEEPQDRAKAWLRGLLALQRNDGRFARGPFWAEPSPYYDGESWLALAYSAQMGLLDDAPGSPLSRADQAMVTRYGENPDIGFFHWGQLATELRYKTTDDPIFVTFAAQQVAIYLADMRPTVSATANRCYSLEGLTAAMATLQAAPKWVVLRETIAERVARVLVNSDALQIKPGADGITIRDGVFLSLPELDQFAGAFLNGRTRPQTRIDMTQHCLAAFLGAEKADFGTFGQ